MEAFGLSAVGSRPAGGAPFFLAQSSSPVSTCPPHPTHPIRLSRIAGLEKRTGGCFGAVVVKNGKIVGEGYNNVISRTDPTW